MVAANTARLEVLELVEAPVTRGDGRTEPEARAPLGNGAAMSYSLPFSGPFRLGTRGVV